MMECFGISELQVEVILNICLCNLVKLEEFKICGEQDELEKEWKKLEVILNFNVKFKKLIVSEICEDMEKYGDDCKFFIVMWEEVKVLDEIELMLVDFVIVVLLKKGWVCVVKGYEVDVVGLSYKVGDEYLMCVLGKLN